MYTNQLGEGCLYYYGARYYDPVLARFISPDNYGDNYVYCNNNPIMYVDPTGNIAALPALVFGIVAAVAIVPPQMWPEFTHWDRGPGKYFGFWAGGQVDVTPKNWELKYKGKGIGYKINTDKLPIPESVKKYMNYEVILKGGVDLAPAGDQRCVAGKTYVGGLIRLGPAVKAQTGISYAPDEAGNWGFMGGSPLNATSTSASYAGMRVIKRENIMVNESSGYMQPGVQTQYSHPGKGITTTISSIGVVEIPGPKVKVGPFEVSAGVFKFNVPNISKALGFDTTPFFNFIGDPVGNIRSTGIYQDSERFLGNVYDRIK